MDSLLALFSRLSTVILNKRMSAYRKGDSALVDNQILSTLYDIVEKTPAPENVQEQAAEVASVTQAEASVSNFPTQNSAGKVSSVVSPETPHKELSNRLRANQSRLSDSKHLGEKLSISVWDHIRTSLRYAREKNAGLAKMHADLANEALQQASRYMTDDEYIELKTSVLAEIQKQRKEPSADAVNSQENLPGK